MQDSMRTQLLFLILISQSALDVADISVLWGERGQCQSRFPRSPVTE